MFRPVASHRKLAFTVIAAALVAAVFGTYALASGSSDSGGASRRVVVHTAHNATLKKTILVSNTGRSLYSLSAEVHGRFICTDAYCRSLWTPIVVPRGTTPAGVASLATVKRPDGRIQVSYRGL